MAEVSLELLQAMVQRVLDEQDSQRRELNAVRSVLLDVVEQGRRTERRITEVKDDVELMVKSELMGRLGYFESRIEARIDALTSGSPGHSGPGA